LGATRELLLPAMFIVCFALYYWLEWPRWAVFACAAPMLALYGTAPLLAARSMAKFDRDSVQLLAARDPARLRARYRRALGMRLFAPPALLAERRAMVLLESGRARAARHAYLIALDELGAAAPLRVVLGFAHASFAVGDDDAAIRTYRQVLDSAGALPGVERKLAHALVRRGLELDVALTLLARTEREVTASDARAELLLLRALALAKLGEHARARELLSQVDAQTDAARALRADVLQQIEGAVVARA
jgi:tetratricopeptide (TPR) repeat protein